MPETQTAPVAQPEPVAQSTVKSHADIICPDAEPTKVLGEGKAKMWINKLDGGRQTMRIQLQKGFDWKASVSPMLPGCPDWCPATHFGYLESGSMKVKFQDGSETMVKAGESYLIKPGHLPVIEDEAGCTMVEFSQDTTYTNEKFVKAEVQEKK